MNDASALEDDALESLVAQAADEFLERLDRGERPEAEEYARRYPRLAGVLPQVLPALKAMHALSQAPSRPPQSSSACRRADDRLLREIGRLVLEKAIPNGNGCGAVGLTGESLEAKLKDIADDYFDRNERGESPDLGDFQRRYPGLSSALPHVLAALESLRSSSRRAPNAPEGAPGLGNLGDYRLLREIGRGGMGVVYEAEQISLGRRVALKVLPFAGTLDAKQLQRFKNEAQAAAQLHHTNIVPVFAVGSERNVHYYAMQFINGQTLAALIHELRSAAGIETAETDHSSGAAAAGDSIAPNGEGAVGAETPPVAPWVTEHSANPASFYRSVASLGKQAAEALEHAHQLGVVHRDIKPANLILEERGNVWVTDFGLARCQRDAGLTLTGDILGTLRYMSPEQALAQRGMVDHRTDIYSLGATLYELLALHPVWDGSDRRELLRQIAWEDPRPPRQWNRAIPVELETIVLKALAKEPAERYATAQELAEDLQRFLEDRPVLAQRPSRAQKLRKWLRRHRAVVWIIALLFMTAMVGSLAASVLIYQEEQRTLQALNREAGQRARAERNLRLALDALDEIYLKVVEDQLPRDPQREEEYRELLQNALNFYEGFAQNNLNDPGVRLETGRAYFRVGTIHQKLHEDAEAEDSFHQSAKLLKELLDSLPNNGAARRELGKTHHSLGLLYRSTGRYHKAEEEYRAALDIRLRLAYANVGGSAFQSELAATHRNLGTVLKFLKKPEDAEKNYQKAIDLYGTLYDKDAENADYAQGLAASWNTMGIVQADAGHFKEAETAYRKALAIYEKLAEHPTSSPAYRQELAAAKNNLGAVLIQLSRLDEATEAFADTFQLRNHLVSDFPSIPDYQEDLAVSHLNLGNVYKMKGEPAEAEIFYRKSLGVLGNLAERYANVPKYREELASGFRGLGILLQDGKRADESIQAFSKSVDIYQKLVKDFPESGDYVKYLGGALYRLAIVEHNPEKLTEARRLLEKSIGPESLDEYERSSPHVAARNNLAWFLATCPEKRFRNPAQALALAKNVVEHAPQVGIAWNTLGVAYYRTGDWKGAIAALTKSMELRNGGDALDWFFLAMAHWRLGETDSARDMYYRAVDWMTQTNRVDDEMRRFRDEAAEVLGLAEPDLTPPEWDPRPLPDPGRKKPSHWAGDGDPHIMGNDNG